MAKQFPGWTLYKMGPDGLVNSSKKGQSYARVNWYESFGSFDEYYHSIDCQESKCTKSAEIALRRISSGTRNGKGGLLFPLCWECFKEHYPEIVETRDWEKTHNGMPLYKGSPP